MHMPNPGWSLTEWETFCGHKSKNRDFRKKLREFFAQNPDFFEVILFARDNGAAEKIYRTLEQGIKHERVGNNKKARQREQVHSD